MASSRRLHGSARGGLGLALLAAQVMQIGTDRIPLVTLVTVIVNVVIFMQLIPALPTVHLACTSNNNVFQKGHWQRLLLSSFYHLDDIHLYYNMVSFIWKGMVLEKKLKSRKFFIVICLFSVLTQLVMLGLNQAFATMFSNKKYLYTCAAGFSAVIFALKVLTTSSSNDNVNVMGIPMLVPSRYACWIELVVIQLLVPNASFTGHLAGILVGLLYTVGPLKKMVDLFDKIFEGPTLQRNRTSYQFQSGTTGTNNHHQPSSRQQQSHYSEDSEDEEIQRAIRESLRDKGHSSTSQQNRYSQSAPPPYGWNIGDNPSPSNRTPYPDFYQGNSPLPSDRNNGNPPYPSGPTNNLYPDLSSYGGEDTYRHASAPPASYSNSHTTDQPSPSSNAWQSTYKSDFVEPRSGISKRTSTVDSRDTSHDQSDDIDELRRARLRRFNKK